MVEMAPAGPFPRLSSLSLTVSLNNIWVCYSHRKRNTRLEQKCMNVIPLVRINFSGTWDLSKKTHVFKREEQISARTVSASLEGKQGTNWVIQKYIFSSVNWDDDLDFNTIKLREGEKTAWHYVNQAGDISTSKLDMSTIMSFFHSPVWFCFRFDEKGPCTAFNNTVCVCVFTSKYDCFPNPSLCLSTGRYKTTSLCLSNQPSYSLFLSLTVQSINYSVRYYCICIVMLCFWQ